MTWDEFKKEIDRQITADGISKDATLVYIDISYPSLDHISETPKVFVDSRSGVVFIEQ